jgi:hypothetical protein
MPPFNSLPAARRLCEKKKRRTRAKPPSESAAAESHTERITISLRLCVFARRKSTASDGVGAQSRQAAKASGGQELQQLDARNKSQEARD